MDDIKCWRENGQAVTNLPPRKFVDHSPDGYEWSYNGSGPADLAMAIVEQYLKDKGFEGRRVKVYQGSVFEAAYALHQKFKEQFIAVLPKKGGTIPFRLIELWIERELEEWRKRELDRANR